MWRKLQKGTIFLEQKSLVHENPYGYYSEFSIIHGNEILKYWIQRSGNTH
jgi:hypothetical protein